ncbi:MAG: hypothetical protein CMO80_16315 [Verrucomicrobiales bacterium]|nr:hypothetical protein [Verrucomicrobiales bacterium]|tara:strand:- start:3241 stop:5181 length:1941 start_codon:yes stop_codon:yes gene_type:complete
MDMSQTGQLGTVESDIRRSNKLNLRTVVTANRRFEMLAHRRQNSDSRESNVIQTYMSVVSRSKKIIFVHIPKTAGTSVTLYFYQRGLIDSNDVAQWYRNNGHKSASFIRREIDERKVCGELRWQDCHKFTIVRNPFDWMISYWHYKRRSHEQRYHEEAQRMCFPEFVSFFCAASDRTFVDQAEWILDEKGEVMVDRIIKLENLKTEWQQLCAQMELPAAPLNDVNRTHGPFYDHDDYYDAESRRLVEKTFARDFKIFDYAYVPRREIQRNSRPEIVHYCPTLGGCCGIAIYTETLCAAKGYGAIRELGDLKGNEPKVLHVQHEFGIIKESEFEEIIDFCEQKNIRLFTTLHRVEKDSWISFLSEVRRAAQRQMAPKEAWQCTLPHPKPMPKQGDQIPRRIGLIQKTLRMLRRLWGERRSQRRIVRRSEAVVVHSDNAQKELQQIDRQKILRISIPLKNCPLADSLHSEKDGRLHIGYFGFLSTGKALGNLVEACKLVPNVSLHLLAAIPQSNGAISEYSDQFSEWIKPHDWIDCNHEFLPLEEIVKRLSQNDVNVYLTKPDANRFATSGSIRQYLAAQRPIIANRSAMVSDLEHVITMLPDGKPSTLATALKNFDPAKAKLAPIVDYCQQNTWEQVPDLYAIQDTG